MTTNAYKPIDTFDLSQQLGYQKLRAMSLMAFLWVATGFYFRHRGRFNMPMTFRTFLRYNMNEWLRCKGAESPRWISCWKGWDFRFTIAPAGYFDPRVEIHFCFIYGHVLISLPFFTKYDECCPPSYGFYCHNNAIWFKIGREVKCIHMPWALEWYRTSYLLKDGQTWDHQYKGQKKTTSYYEVEAKKALWSQQHPYRYILKSGEVQKRTATITIEEREWRRRWLMWTSLFSKGRKTISVEFDGEVGERTGSWKGGVLGTGYELQIGESPLACLRRMEREREFN